MKKILFAVLALAMISCSGKDDGGQVIAVVNGEKITMKDLKEKYTELDKQLENLEKQAFKYKKYYLGEMVESKLIELEAKKRGMSVADLLKTEVNSKIQPVSEADIKKFAEERNIPKDRFDELKPRIKQYLESQGEGNVRKSFAAALKKAYNVKLMLAEDKGPAVKVDITGDDPVRGNKDASVTVVEFSEFECPYCRRGAMTFNKLYQEYKDSIKHIFKHYPLPFHQHAMLAAQAAICAQDQGKFYEYHDILFENNDRLEAGDLVSYAKRLNLDSKKFEDCLKGGAKKAKVESDMEQGKKIQLSGVPVFIINGRKLVGAVPEEQLREAIEEAINE